jgi:hypothetical protein
MMDEIRFLRKRDNSHIVDAELCERVVTPIYTYTDTDGHPHKHTDLMQNKDTVTHIRMKIGDVLRD